LTWLRGNNGVKFIRRDEYEEYKINIKKSERERDGMGW
jgi:hypothetical protein